MPYDVNKEYSIPFRGGPFDGRRFNVLPAPRQVHEQKATNGVLIKRHVYNLREGVNPENGDVLQLEYVYQE